MRLKDKLPLSYLLFTNRGRIPRSTYWLVSTFIWSTFYVLHTVLHEFVNEGATYVLYPLLLGSLVATANKRLHDTNRSGYWLLTVLIPVLGPLWLIYQLGFRRGDKQPNTFGTVPDQAADYFKNDNGQPVSPSAPERIINDVTQLNPVVVADVFRPTSVSDLQERLRTTTGPVSVGGGRFSMGGQTASPHSLHIDMRGLNQVIQFAKEERRISVQAGIRWCDIQRFIDPHDLSIKIMQTYANFTVGGALSVNCHGRYMGHGPIILSVRSIELVLADGSLVHASRTENPDLFFGTIGGYNGLGIIVSAELDLEDNLAVRREHHKLTRSNYRNYFAETIRDNPQAVFHNGDMYPPAYTNMRAVTWVKTTEPPTVKSRLMPLRESYPLERYFMWAFTETAAGKWRREHIVDPLLYMTKPIHWRNYEAGYDVAELEPRSRTKRTYVLQEYFVPIRHFDDFSAKMSEIFNRYRVNVINVSVRHALPDSGSYLAWAREEVFAFVVYYKQRTNEVAKNEVAIWTRELIDAALSVGGAYYLPYQAHATPEQFHKAYPNAGKLFALKKNLDPTFRFHNVFWDTYYQQPDYNATPPQPLPLN
ncbi:FAD-binding protein [Spirosoma sp. HMF3257]|uniref:FAD-binding protein n=1 Tax=Spirosoma telluris TaxID=2183553 RepID=A0A327NPH1_9BACT|nr:FAD-binding protein [Spirosoma telluris]RAI77260.1 FAD-binding protein [Spirosoma telluris]